MRATTLLAADVLKLWTSSWSHSQETNRPVNQCIAAPTGRIITVAAGGRAERSLTMLRCVCSGVKNETLLCCANVVLREKQSMVVFVSAVCIVSAPRVTAYNNGGGGSKEPAVMCWRGATAALSFHPNPLGTDSLVNLKLWRMDRQLGESSSFSCQ